MVADSGEVFDRHDDGQVELLVAGGLDDVDGECASKKGGHGFGGSDGGRQPDALRRRVEECVETFQREGEVRSALGAGDGVHLVDDHGRDVAQRLARLGGEHQVERLGSGDQQCARPAQLSLPFGGRGVTGSDGDRDVGRGQTLTFVGVTNAGERRTQVAFDVDREGFERRDVQDGGGGVGCGFGCASVERP